MERMFINPLGKYKFTDADMLSHKIQSVRGDFWNAFSKKMYDAAVCNSSFHFPLLASNRSKAIYLV